MYVSSRPCDCPFSTANFAEDNSSGMATQKARQVTFKKIIKGTGGYKIKIVKFKKIPETAAFLTSSWK